MNLVLWDLKQQFTVLKDSKHRVQLITKRTWVLLIAMIKLYAIMQLSASARDGGWECLLMFWMQSWSMQTLCTGKISKLWTCHLHSFPQSQCPQPIYGWCHSQADWKFFCWLQPGPVLAMSPPPFYGRDHDSVIIVELGLLNLEDVTSAVLDWKEPSERKLALAADPVWSICHSGCYEEYHRQNNTF